MHLSRRIVFEAETHLAPWFLFLALAGALAFRPDAHAQGNGRPTPRLGYVYPAGGQVGTTVTVHLGGQNLTGAVAAYFSNFGLEAKVVGYERPLNQKEINDLRDKIDALQLRRSAFKDDPTKPAFTPEDEAAIADARAKLTTRPGRLANPAISENVTLEITVAADAPPGERELRLRTGGGLSNPFVFVVGQLPEYVDPVIVSSNPAADGAARPTLGPRPATAKKIDPVVTLPAVVNGQILPGEVDRYRFSAKQGQRLTLAASARVLIPYLADAVPGWFQATLALYDARGREVAYDDDFRFNPDPVLFYTIPVDGDYTVEIKDSIYRGREDFIYRITLGELPFVTGIFPLGCAPAATSTFAVTGWNLPTDHLAMSTRDRRPGTYLLSIRKEAQLSNSVRFAVDPSPESADSEPNNQPTQAQALTLPTVVNGRIERPNDEDVFRFEGKAGDELAAEVTARRLNSPLDSVLRLTDASGRVIATNDDFEDKGAGLLAHQADSRLSIKLPADGTYFLRIADTQHQGGPDYAYRLRVGAPRPDFELRVVPSTLNLRAGASTPLTVYALRRDGFAGAITLGLHHAPAGFRLSGTCLPADQEKVSLTLTAPATPREEPYELSLAGLATIAGQSIAHVAVPADDQMQAFLYRHLVPAKLLLVDVSGRSQPFRLISTAPVRFTPGGTVKVQLSGPAARNLTKLQFELTDAPAGLSVASSTAGAGDTITLVLACDPAKAKPGARGNLLLTGFGERPNAKAKSNQRTSLGTVPAIPYEILAIPPPPPATD